ncbi:hypothetical protein NFI96_011413, partial [Prochilodus magdalenae]
MCVDSVPANDAGEAPGLSSDRAEAGTSSVRTERTLSVEHQNSLNYIALDLREDPRAGSTLDAPPSSPSAVPLLENGAYASIDFTKSEGITAVSKVLQLTWVVGTTSTMVRYLDPTEIAQEEQDEHCQSPTAVNVSDQTIRSRPHEGGLRARRPVVGPVLTGQHHESRFYLSTCDRRGRLWRRCGECYAVCNIIQHDWFGGGSVMVWGGISLEGRTDLYRLDNGTLTAIRHQDEILGPVVRPYAGAVGPGFLLVHNNARPHVARVCRQFLENEGIDTIDWPTGSPDLNPIEHLWDIMFRFIRCHQVALRTVQELSDALVQIWEKIPQDTIHYLIRS